ncbi:PAS domain-containing protein [Streptomyces pratensis]|uniref:PAS domain-containing protein n=1 Tax=Streptomyces pratensis TaxID=1169025 RepID=UPI00301910B3
MSSRPSRGTARLAAILDALPDGLLLVNCNGTVVNANAIALEMFETPGAALVGRGLLDLLPGFDSKLIPGSMRRPDAADEHGRTKPARMTARRTDRREYPVEVTSASLDSGQAAYNDIHSSYTGDELLMIVVRDLSGTVDTEAELARSQRQTEMILRAASEGVVGTDTDGRVVLVNPAAAQILGFRASDLGGQELHPLILHSRAEGDPFPYEESPLADTLKSGRKHRVRGQVLWSKSGAQVPVDLTTAPVRDGDQLVGAVMTFTDRRPYEELSAQHADAVAELTEGHSAEVGALKEAHAAELAALREAHTAELADRSERYAAQLEEQAERLAALSAQHSQLTAVLGGSLRGPLEELRGELSTLAADPAGQLWPEANQILHHLAAGYARMTTLVDNVLGYQRLDAGVEGLVKAPAMLDAIVTGGIDGAVELIGPGRAQFAVHAPPIEAEVDARQLATALAHLVADVAGVDSTGKARAVPGGGYLDSTVVVAAAQRGDVVRIEVRGPYAGGDPVHEPIVRGIVRAHGGVLQTHQVPGTSGSAYVLDVPIGTASGTLTASGTGAAPRTAEHSSAPGHASLPEGAPTPDQAPLPKRAPLSARAPLPEAAPAAEAAPVAEAAPTPVAVPAPAAAPAPGPASPSGSLTAAPADAPAASGTPAPAPAPEGPGAPGVPSGRRRARRSSTDAFLERPGGAPEGLGGDEAGAVPPSPHDRPAAEPTGRRRARRGPAAPEEQQAPELIPAQQGEGSGRRRGRPSPFEAEAANAAPGAGAQPGEPRAVSPEQQPQQPQRQALALTSAPSAAPPSEGSVVTAAEGAQGVGARPQLGQTVPPQGVPADPQQPVPPTGRRARRDGEDQPALPALASGSGSAGPEQPHAAQPQQPGGRRARRALAAAQERTAAEAGPRTAFALPPADADRAPQAPGPAATPGGAHASQHGRSAPEAEHTPPQAHPVAPTRPGRPAPETAGHLPAAPAAYDSGVPQGPVQRPAPGIAPHDSGEQSAHAPGAAYTGTAPDAAHDPQAARAPQGTLDTHTGAAGQAAHAPGAPPTVGPAVGPAAGRTAHTTGTSAAPSPVAHPADGDAGVPVPNPRRQPLPAEEPTSGFHPDSTQGRAFSVRTLGQGVPFAHHLPHQQTHEAPHAQQGPQDPQSPHHVSPPAAPQAPHAQQAPRTPQHQSLGGAGRRRKLATPPDVGPTTTGRPAGGPEAPHQQARGGQQTSPPPGPVAADAPEAADSPPTGPSSGQGPAPGYGDGQLIAPPLAEGRAYAIGAPDEGAEGPEPLDGPGGAVEVANRPHPYPVDDELPPEPLDNPRRLLVWPAPDVPTQQALSDRGYRPVIVHSREEVDAQIAAFPAALFVDPLTGPITRTALQSLRQAAVAAEVPVLVTAGLGQATREAAYGADPAVLLKALAPRDSEQHPPRVLLIEEQEAIAVALTETLERRGMQVARAATDSEAVDLAGRMRPNLVVMDLMQVRRRRAGIVDWLRANGQLNRTPLVVYTSARMDPSELPRLASGETVLFLAERSTSDEVQARIVDLLAKIGTN